MINLSCILRRRKGSKLSQSTTMWACSLFLHCLNEQDQTTVTLPEPKERHQTQRSQMLCFLTAWSYQPRYHMAMTILCLSFLSAGILGTDAHKHIPAAVLFVFLTNITKDKPLNPWHHWLIIWFLSNWSSFSIFINISFFIIPFLEISYQSTLKFEYLLK